MTTEDSAASPRIGGAEPRPVLFEEFYRSQFTRVVAVVYALSGSRVAAEEIAQDAFVKAHDRWPEVASHPNAQAWIRRVAINLAMSGLRRRATEAKVMLRLSRERPRVAELPELAEATWAAVRDLPRNQAVAITLRYHDDLDVESIAAVLHCKPATVRVHLHRGRTALAAVLGTTEETDLETPDGHQRSDDMGHPS